MLKRLYFSGLWLVSGNPKNSREHYLALLDASFALLRSERVVFFYDDPDLLESVSVIARAHSVDLRPIEAPIDALPGRVWAKSIVDGCTAMHLDKFTRPADLCREKGAVHYWRDLKGGGAEVFEDLVTIWLSKVDLVLREIDLQDEAAEYIWVDASVARFSGMRTNWDFRRVSIPKGKIGHYGNSMRFLSQQLPLNASFMAGDAAAWQQFGELYRAAAEQCAGMPYGHDEETVIAQCVAREPGLFHKIGGAIEPGRAQRRTPFLRLKHKARQFWSRVGAIPAAEA